MKLKRLIQLFAIIAIVSVFSSCAFITAKNEKSTINVTVELNYGEGKTSRHVKVDGENGITALEALQRSAKVETHVVGKCVFVASIDNVKGERGKMAWYYNVNGVSAKIMAISNKLKDGDVVTWNYTKDVCSCTVDRCCSK